LVKVFRKEARENNIHVSSIYPGGVDTAFRDISKPKYLNPEEVADSILFMMLFKNNGVIDELVIRPMIERNYL